MNIETDKTQSPERQASSAWQTFKDRDDWITLLLASDLSCTAKIIATKIALHHNIKTGRCDPSINMLASSTGTSKNTVLRSLRELEKTGWARVARSRGGRSLDGIGYTNSFEVCVPNGATHGTVNGAKRGTVDEGATVPNETGKGAKSEGQGCQNGGSKGATVGTQTAKNSEENHEENSEEIDSPGLDLGEEDGRRRSETHGDIGSSFEEWWLQYPRKVDKAAAKKSYRRVVQTKQATPAELLSGAMRYAAERSGQDPKFTKHPTTWLNAGSWANEPAAPPIAPGITLDGQSIATPPPNRPPPANAHAARLQDRLDRLKAQSGGAS